MNIPKPLFSMIDAVTIQVRTEIDGKPARRTSAVTEVVAIDRETRELVLNNVFVWDPRSDSFQFSGQSHIIERNMEKRGLTKSEVAEELRRRRTVLEWMVSKGIRRYEDVAKVIREYYVNPKRTYKKSRMDV